MSIWRTGWMVALGFSVVGCASIGPATIDRDQFDYNQAIASSQKQQLLLNMVRLRYGEAPMFMSVASVIAQYSIEGAVSVNSPGWDRPNQVGPPVASGVTRWTDRPTISYQPLTGGSLAKTLLTPVTVEAAFSLVQSGWPVHTVLQGTVRTLNGIGSYSGRQGIQWNPRFLEGIAAIAEVSALGLGMVRRDGERTFFAINPEMKEAAHVAALERMRSALNLDTNASEYELVVSGYRGAPNQLTLTMSSVLDVLNVISSQFEVPAEHVANGWTYRSTPRTASEFAAPGIVVRSGLKPPENAFVATYERGAWFWIDEGDYASKRGFSFLTMLMTLAESGGTAGPMLTIGTGGP